MPTYRVEWAIDIDAESPEEAARIARDQYHGRPGCGLYLTQEHDAPEPPHMVDLDA